MRLNDDYVQRVARHTVRFDDVPESSMALCDRYTRRSLEQY